MRLLVLRTLTAATVCSALLGLGTAAADAAARTAAEPVAHASAAPAAHARTAVRPASAAIGSAEAWYYCRSRIDEFDAGTRPGPDPFRFNPYRTRFVAQQAHGRWKVQLVGELGQGARTQGVDASYCVVGGTTGRPALVSYLFPR